MEIERKWMVKDWPQGLEQCAAYTMRQGYIALRPTVRIREEALEGGRTAYVLCFKGPAGPDGLAREEIESEIEPELFDRLCRFIGKPLIEKTQRRYRLPGELILEVSLVDEGLPTEFRYAEVEFPTEEMARAWQPPEGLTAYLEDEVTGQPGQSMGSYWRQTRGLME